MFKIAILGTENSHAAHFAAAIAEGLFPELALMGVYGDEAGNEKVKAVCPDIRFADSYTDFLGKVDGVMVTARHGGLHLPYARPYLEQGLPVWIDKPICASIEDMRTLAALSKEYSAPICGGSSLVHTEGVRALAEYARDPEFKVVGGNVTAPVDLANPYGNFWFYSQHLVQMITAIFGDDIISVTAVKGETHVRAEYFYDRFSVTAFYGTGYTACVYKERGRTECVKIALPKDYIVPELREFEQMLKTKKMPVPYRSFAAPVFIIDATIRAFETGRRAKVERL